MRPIFRDQATIMEPEIKRITRERKTLEAYAWLDDRIGNSRAVLENLGIAENTIVILFPASLMTQNPPKDSPKSIVPWCLQKKTAHGFP